MLRMYDVISNKRDGHVLSKDEIDFFIKGYTDGSIPDYQASALMMAILLKGMTREETFNLTMAMARSGDSADLSKIDGIKVDKHSTGGVGDKTTLIIAPIAASFGVKVAKMSGRGLGHTGGTVDKLESIPGYRTALTIDEFYGIVNRVGLSVIGQSGNFAPADKKLYALRDVTATVESIPLITASIMSKKLAAGSDCILLDVKTGSGSFMKTLDDSKRLALSMVDVGERAGRRVMAMITNMDRPLGSAVGNSLEVIEAVETLQGHGPSDLTELCIDLSGNMLYLAGKGSEKECRDMAAEAIANGSAFKKLVEMVDAHGGDKSYLLDTAKFPTTKYLYEVKAKKSGYIVHTDTEKIGMASLLLGAGRNKKEDAIDYAAGIKLIKKTGDIVNKDDVIAVLHTNDKDSISGAEERIIEALQIDGFQSEVLPVVFLTLDKRDLT